MPDWKEEISRQLASLNLSPVREAEIVEELAQHLDDRYRELLTGGATEPCAHRMALEELSDKEPLGREFHRLVRGVTHEPIASGTGERRGIMRDAWLDLCYAARSLRLNPAFGLVAILSLALGIGANTAIFQLLDAVRLRTLPVENPQELVAIQLADRTGWRGSQQTYYPALTNPLWEETRNRQQVFSGMVAWADDFFNLVPAGELRPGRGLWVNGDFFSVLGVRPMVGRVFTRADDHRGCGLPGAVVSYAFWQRELGGNASAIGRKLTIDDHIVEIIGVTPANFFGLEVGRSFDVALPICSQAVLGGENNWLDAGTVWELSVMGRLKPGISLPQAAAQLRAASPGIFQATLPKNYPRENVKDYLKFKLAADAGGNGVSWLRDQYENPLWFLLATAALVLLIACANLANLLLARASAREKEVAVRLALGAWRGRLIRQMMAESFLLAGLGAGLAVLLGRTLSRLLVSFLSTEGNLLSLNLSPDWRVLGFTAGLAILTCFLFGLTPAWRATLIAPAEAMKAGSRGLTSSRERFGLRRALVAAQVALSLVLLVGALLFSRSLMNLLTVDPGFHENGILVADVDFSRLNLPAGRRLAFKQELLARLGAIPGVESVAEASFIPLGGSGRDNTVWTDGSDRKHGIDSNINSVSRDYFKTLGVPLLAGRELDDRDTPASPKVAIINQVFARQLGLGANPVGGRFWREATPSEPEAVFEIVGMVKNTKYGDVRENFRPIAFLASSQDSSPDAFAQILIRSDAPAADLTSRLRGGMAEISPEMTTVYWVFKTMIREKLMPERLIATLSGFFGLVAGLLAAIGLYGVVSYAVARRRNEIGIRMALGAERRDVLWIVLRETLWLALVGVAIGVPCALVAARVASGLLFGLKSYDPATIGLAALVIIVVGVLAGFLPARRASRVDPMVALHYE